MPKNIKKPTKKTQNIPHPQGGQKQPRQTFSRFFTEKAPSHKVMEGKGPGQLEILESQINNESWVVLNAKKYLSCNYVKRDTKLRTEVNALKHALQTFGPIDKPNIPDFRQNEGKAKNHIWHGHAWDNNGCEFVLEWAIIDVKKKIMAIVNFAPHKGYTFRQNPLSEVEKQSILNDYNNIVAIDRAEKQKKFALAKHQRVQDTYKYVDENTAGPAA